MTDRTYLIPPPTDALACQVFFSRGSCLPDSTRSRGIDCRSRNSQRPGLLHLIPRRNGAARGSDMDYGSEVRRRLEAEPAIQRILMEMEITRRKAEKSAVAKDPEKHKLTTLMAKNANYRIWRGGRDSKGRQVDFCYSSWKNIAGYYLSWREVFDQANGEGFRDKWVGHKQRKAASAMMERWAEEFRAETDE